MSAADQFAALTRQQWQDYVSQFIPFENDLLEYARNPAVVTQNVEQARAGVAAAFDAQQGITQRKLRAKQQTLTPEEQAAMEKQTALSRSLADVQAANTAREMTVSRQRSVAGAVPSPGVGG